MSRPGRKPAAIVLAFGLILGSTSQAFGTAALAEGNAGIVLIVHDPDCPSNADPVRAISGISNGSFGCDGIIGGAPSPGEAFSGRGISDDGSIWALAGAGDVKLTGTMTFEKYCVGPNLLWGTAQGELSFSLNADGLLSIGGQLIDVSSAKADMPFRVSWVGPHGKGLESGLLTITVNDRYVLQHANAVILTSLVLTPGGCDSYIQGYIQVDVLDVL